MHLLSPRIKRFGWSTLRSIGNSRAIQSASIWILVVPILAKTLSLVNDVATFSVFGGEITLNLALPFSLKAFFFGALAFAIGNLIWNIKCPRIIRSYRSFDDFLKTHGTERLLKSFYLETIGHYEDRGLDPNEFEHAYKIMLDFVKSATGKRFSQLSQDEHKFAQEIFDIPTQNVDKILGYPIEKRLWPDFYRDVISRSQTLNYKARQKEKLQRQPNPVDYQHDRNRANKATNSQGKTYDD